MICDAHIHYIPQELSEHTSFYRGVWTRRDALYRYLEEEGIERALLVYPSTDAHLKIGIRDTVRMYNSAAERVMRDNPKVLAAALVNPHERDSLEVQIDSLARRGFRAVSLSSSYEGKFLVRELFPLFDAAARHQMAVYIHPQTINPIGFERVKDPLLMPVLEYSFDLSMCMGLMMMEGVFSRFPLPFVFSSLGGVIPLLAGRFDRVYAMLRARGYVKDLGRPPTEILGTVYVDISGATPATLALARDLYGDDRLLWGSDYPVHADADRRGALLADVPAAARRKIQRENFFAVFGMTIPPGKKERE
ncbi:MAG: amidohydrolase family protein [Candidatus Omnitrophica bacterium]|nr:amidohydrolase family protein [Candidatus Omnitrophota bacterium]